MMDEEDPSLNVEWEKGEEEVMGEKDTSMDEEGAYEVMSEEDPSLDEEWETDDEEMLGKKAHHWMWKGKKRRKK